MISTPIPHTVAAGETVGGAYYFLDLTALGRQEDWEEPKGRTTGLGPPAGSDKILYADEYGSEKRRSDGSRM